jgi:hypothetical protein
MWQCEIVGKIDFLELFAGSARLSQACAVKGLRVGSPVDIRTGFDLLTRTGQNRTMKIIADQEPEIIFMAPVCGPWSSWSNMLDPLKRDAERKRNLPMIHFVARVAQYQIKRGRYFVIENPENLHCGTFQKLHHCRYPKE